MSEENEIAILDNFSMPEVILPALDNLNEIQDNPAISYLISLGSMRSRQTMGSFLSIAARLLGYPSLHECPWGELRKPHIAGIIEKLRVAEKAPATINTYISALKGVSQAAWSMKKMDTDNYLLIKNLKPSRGSRLAKGRALSKNEIAQLFLVCEIDPSPSGLRDAAIISVLLGCGLRRSEVVGLDLASLDIADQSLKVLGKGNKERLVFMPKGTFKRVMRWINEIRGELSGPLFTRIRRFGDVTSERLTDQAVYFILSTRGLAAGIEKFAPHDMRRTFASAMFSNDEDILTVRDAMGHASVTTTQIYDHRGNERLRLASQRLNIDMD